MPHEIVGVDGCAGRWLAVKQRIDCPQLVPCIHASPTELVRSYARHATICVDVPIGLTDKGPRACDVQARQLLGRPRQSSVFRAPIRPTLAATTREEASAIGRQADGVGVGCQAWGIYPYVRQWDDLLRSKPVLRNRVFEVHPEVSFFAMNGNAAMGCSKRTAAGANERRQLLNAVFGARPVAKALHELEGERFGLDDLYDALAALWTARRVTARAAQRLPRGKAPVDRYRIKMLMHY